MRRHYENERLYCPACTEQPVHFERDIRWQNSHVTPEGEVVEVKEGDVRYEWQTCGGEAKWGSELNQEEAEKGR